MLGDHGDLLGDLGGAVALHVDVQGLERVLVLLLQDVLDGGLVDQRQLVAAVDPQDGVVLGDGRVEVGDPAVGHGEAQVGVDVAGVALQHGVEALGGQLEITGTQRQEPQVEVGLEVGRVQLASLLELLTGADLVVLTHVGQPHGVADLRVLLLDVGGHLVEQQRHVVPAQLVVRAGQHLVRLVVLGILEEDLLYPLLRSLEVAGLAQSAGEVEHHRHVLVVGRQVLLVDVRGLSGAAAAGV